MSEHNRFTVTVLYTLLTLSLLGNCWQFFSSLNSRASSPTFVRQNPDPGLSDARASLAQSGMIWLQRGELQKAIDAMERLRQQAPTQAAELQINWLQALYNQLEDKQFERVQSAVQALLVAYPNNEDYLLLQADVFERTGQPRRAADTFYGIADQPSLDDQEHIIANARRLALVSIEQNQQQQQWPQALEYLDQLLWREPDYIPFILALVRTHIQQGDLDQAALHLNRVPANDAYSEQISQLRRQLQNSQQPATSQLALETQGQHFVLPLTLNSERQIKLMIDTGASLSVISQSQLQQLPSAQFQRTISLSTAGGQVQADVYRVASVQIGPYRLSDIEFASLPLAQLSADGLLGMNILGRFRFSIDSEAALLQLEQL